MTPTTTWERAVADLTYAEQSADELREQLEVLERRSSTIRRFLSIHEARLDWAERAGVAAEPRFGTAEPVERAALHRYEGKPVAFA